MASFQQNKQPTSTKTPRMMTANEKATLMKLYEAKRSSGIVQADFLRDAKEAGFPDPTTRHSVTGSSNMN
jgi:hypothetical protein